jgi:hypothetical protein
MIFRQKRYGLAGKEILVYHFRTMRVREDGSRRRRCAIRGARVLLFFCRHRVSVLGCMVRVIFNSDIACRLSPDIHLPRPYKLVVHPAVVIGNRGR